DQFRYETQRLFLQLRHRLPDADDEADQQPGQHHRQADDQRHHDRVAAQFRSRFDRHHHPVSLTLSISIPTVNAQPSMSTNNSNLNGSDTSTGGSIIMPILMRSDEITMSITRNGR